MRSFLFLFFFLLTYATASCATPLKSIAERRALARLLRQIHRIFCVLRVDTDGCAGVGSVRDNLEGGVLVLVVGGVLKRRNGMENFPSCTLGVANSTALSVTQTQAHTRKVTDTHDARAGARTRTPSRLGLSAAPRLRVNKRAGTRCQQRDQSGRSNKKKRLRVNM